MYNLFQLSKKYLSYYIKAANGKGHGIHSPFVYDLVRNVLNDKKTYEQFVQYEKLRQDLLRNHREINVRDFGAGSSVVKTNSRKISEIASSSLKTKKYAQLLFRLVKYFNPTTVVELGTSLGISTCYIASAVPHAQVITCEGDESIASVAENNFNVSGLKNISVVCGSFDSTLPEVLNRVAVVDLAYIDGNHRKEPTVNYFHLFQQHGNDNQVLIFDDVHWSKEMEEAWELIKSDPRVTLTIDLFFIGLIFFRKDFKAKQHFTIRY